jgi:hypothetical protein
VKTYSAASPRASTRDAAVTSMPGAGVMTKSTTPLAGSALTRRATSPVPVVTNQRSPSRRTAFANPTAHLGK